MNVVWWISISTMVALVVYATWKTVYRDEALSRWWFVAALIVFVVHVTTGVWQ